MRGKTLIGLLMPLVTIAVACSDGDGAPATSTATAPVGTASSTTAAPPPTTPLPTTPPTTVAPVTTAPPTAPPTTAPPTLAPGSIEEQVVAAALESWRLLNEALADPFNDDKVAVAGQAHTGPLRQVVVETVADFRLNNWRLVANPEIAAAATPYPGEAVVDTGADAASVTYCEVNPWAVVQTGGSPDGTDLVVDDDISSQRIRLDLRLVEGRWLAAEAELIEDYPGAATCPDLL